MTITARYPGRCTTCGGPITSGQQIEWAKGSQPRHADCATATTSAPPAAATTPAALTYETVGPRVYVRGNSFPYRDAIRAAGGHWDADEKAWWVGVAKADGLKAALVSATPSTTPYRKRITSCLTCGAGLDTYQVRRGYKFCGPECTHGGQSYRDSHGNFVLGSDD